MIDIEEMSKDLFMDEEIPDTKVINDSFGVEEVIAFYIAEKEA